MASHAIYTLLNAEDDGGCITTSIRCKMLTISDLKSVIDEEIKMGENNSDNKTVDIVNVFGGIMNLLEIIIDLNDKSILSQNRINIIHQIISAPKKFQQTHDTISTKAQIKTDKNYQNEDGAPIQLKLDATNTYLTSFVGESSSFKINSLIHHKVSVLSVVVSFILYLILTRVCDPFVWIMYFNIFCPFIWLPYCILWALSVNKTVFKKIVKTADFWIQLFYIGKYQISNFWYGIMVGAVPVSIDGWIILACILGLIFLQIFTVIILSFDGVNGNRNSKKIFSAFFGSLFLFTSVWYSYQAYLNDDSVVHIYGDVHISLFSSMVSSSEIISIFMFKQLILTLVFKERATSIVYRPFIKWEKEPNGLEQNQNKSNKSAKHNTKTILIDDIELHKQTNETSIYHTYHPSRVGF